MDHSHKPFRRRKRYSGLLLAGLVLAYPGYTLAWKKNDAQSSIGLRPQPVAVFGADERVPLPPAYRDLKNKMGLLFNPRSHMVCTAFCVAPDTIATAGHCLFRVAGESAPQISEFWFARNYDAVHDYARVAGHTSGAAAQHVLSGAATLNMRPPIDATKDWAIVRLERAICTLGVLPVRPLPTEQIMAAAAAKQVFQVSYHRDFTPWKLAFTKPCEITRNFDGAEWKTIAGDFSDPDALLLHTCDTGGASSGSPLLMETEKGPEVIGINVGTYVQSKVEMQEGELVRRFKSETVANTGVSATTFAAKLEAFRRANILSTGAEIREMQTALKRLNFYDGPVDSTYSPALRSAIEAFEKEQGVTVTGLATHALLKRLHGAALEKGKTRPTKGKTTDLADPARAARPAASAPRPTGVLRPMLVGASVRAAEKPQPRPAAGAG